MNKRVILIVLDSLGVGYAEDAHLFGDENSNTLGHILEKCSDLKIPNLSKFGILNLPGMSKYHSKNIEYIKGSYGRMKEISVGKDTTTGHWEIAGLETKEPFQTYPDGFPKEFIEAFEKKIGRKTVGNISISGTEIIEKLGEHHEKTGDIIVYTSDDSVFQIAANVDVIPLDELYKICKIAREMLIGKWACARVIARPYKIIDNARIRTSDRHDYSVDPHGKTMLNYISQGGKEVYSIGKIRDIFNGCGITKSVSTKDNLDGIVKTIEAIKTDFEGLIFTNLVDFDSKYGHRRNPEGYGVAIEEFDRYLPEIIKNMKSEDILILTADHGNDPTFKGFNHTREYVPLLVIGDLIKENNKLGTLNTFADISATICDYLDVENTGLGTSFLKKVLK